MKILLSNDDSYHALGLHILKKELMKIGDVWVVAPTEEKSTTGHSLTLHKPLRMTYHKNQEYAVSGSPADCVYVGIREVLKEIPDIVISGINRGANLGQDVYYSGTVSAAREACIMGIPALAVSLSVDFKKRKPETELHYLTAAKLAVKTVSLLKKRKISLPEHTFLNLNSPDIDYSKVKGFKLVKQGFRYYSGTVLKRTDHRGRDYFWVGGQYKGFREESNTDCSVVNSGYASLTPLRLDSTDYDFLEAMSSEMGRGFR